MASSSLVRKSAVVALIALLSAFAPTARAAALTITTPATQTAVSGNQFSLQIVASGGTGGNQFTLASGSLPAGLALETNTGLISGTPTTSVSASIAIRVTDNSSASATTSSFLINTGWMVSTFAGNGNQTTSGDGGPATSAGMLPHALSIRSDGTVYFSDVTAGSLRRVDSNGNVQNLSTPGSSITGLVVRDNGDLLYNIYSGTNPIKKFTASNSVTSNYSASSPTFNMPRGLNSDQAGNLYLADAGNHVIRKIAADGSMTTVAGNGSAATSGDGSSATSAAINYPGDVAIGSDGSLYITELNGNALRKVSPSGVITTLIANGSYVGENVAFANARTPGVWGVAVDGGNNVFVMEKNGIALRRIDAITGQITRVAGTGISGTNGSPVNGISSLATFSTLVMVMRFDRQGNLYVIDYSNNMIRRIAGIGAPFTTPVATAALSAGSGWRKGVSQNISATLSTEGRVTFLANGKRIPGCINKIASGTAPITVTCAWKPTASGSLFVSAILTPTDNTLSQASARVNVAVARRAAFR